MTLKDRFTLTPLAALGLLTAAAASEVETPTAEAAVQLEAVKVTASADASAQGLSKPYAGGQVARGGRAGILGTTYDLPWLRALALDARVVHTGDSYYDAANQTAVPDWTRFDLGAIYDLPVGTRTVTLRGRVDNVSDENYYASAGGFPGQGYLVVGAPRTFALSAAIDF
ncbi:MAG: TonB-dependent receptor [Stagnimonas sp.]|nr:TonB-dependent receptor [Stagnimonas sp.]